jgi:hypothetical protein
MITVIVETRPHDSQKTNGFYISPPIHAVDTSTIIARYIAS